MGLGRGWIAPVAGCLLGLWPAAAGAELAVVVTIKPLHALVARVMQGVATPELLVKGRASPHSFALKPSEAKLVNDADLFFRMGEAVEPFTARIVEALPPKVEVVTLQEAPGVRLLARRTGATFAGHSHADGTGPRAVAAVDGHAWLDPYNAVAMVARIEHALAARDPNHAAAFKANASALRADLEALAAELGRELAPIARKPYVVFHDALQYLERRYHLNAVGSIAVSPEVPPSGKRLTQLRRRIAALGAMCVFAEPLFDTRLVANLIEGTPARTATLDPEGSTLEPGPQLYFTLMRRLAGDLKGCLAPPA